MSLDERTIEAIARFTDTFEPDPRAALTRVLARGTRRRRLRYASVALAAGCALLAAVVVPKIVDLGEEPIAPAGRGFSTPLTVSAFQVALSFEDLSGWRLVSEGRDLVTLEPVEAEDFDVSFLRVRRVYAGPSEGFVGAPTSLHGYIIEHPDLEVSGPAATQIVVGGAPGGYFDVSAAPGDGAIPSVCGEPCAPLFRTGQPNQTFSLAAGEGARIILLNVDGEPVTLVIRADGDRLQEALILSRDLIDSLTIGLSN